MSIQVGNSGGVGPIKATDATSAVGQLAKAGVAALQGIFGGALAATGGHSGTIGAIAQNADPQSKLGSLFANV